MNDKVMKKIKIISCLVTIGIMVLIFYFSSQNSAESSKVSSGITKKLVELVTSVSHLSAEEKQMIIETIHGIIRKIAHFTIYASLGMSAFVSIKLITQKKKTVVFAITAGFCMLYAISDELHQLFSTGRSGEIRDVLIDTAGAVTGILFLLIAAAAIKRIINRRRSVI